MDESFGGSVQTWLTKCEVVFIFLRVKISDSMCNDPYFYLSKYLYTYFYLSTVFGYFTHLWSHQSRSNKLFTQRIMKDLHYTNLHIDLQTNMGLQSQDERPLFVHWTHLTCIVYEVRGAKRSNMGESVTWSGALQQLRGLLREERTCIRHCQPP